MEIIILLVALIQSMAISLGVGSSTIAIINFFVAICDGSIDPTERHMMGAVYVVLRVAMVIIFFTTVLLIGYNTYHLGAVALSSFVAAQATVIAMLYGNAILMTLRIMPSTVGPALQAGSWYTLGILAALVPLGQSDFTYIQFILGYAAVVVLAISLVNGVMAYQKSKRVVTPPAAS
jgi:hypothetical protein